MEIGWIDFSKEDRNKVFNVLNLLGEKGVLDELGISSIRDSYSDLFFPGTSTIQTRAKYFLIVPYALKDLDYSNSTNPNKLLKEFDKKEEKCAHIFFENNPNEGGIIGINAIQRNSWVKRPPSNIYLAGLRKFKIFNYNISLKQYLKAVCSQKQEKNNIISLGNNEDKTESNHDDKNAGVNPFSHLLTIPTYYRNWVDDLKMNLTYDEGQFLKNQIISNCSDSMFAFILENNLREVLNFNSFKDLEPIIFKFPKEIQDDYFKANNFSEFIYALRIIYNLMVSNYKNENAIEQFSEIKDNLDEISKIDINEIMFRLKIDNPKLKIFLNESKELMENNDIEKLKEVLLSREIFLKGKNRSKLSHPGEYDINQWFAGERLDYRFGNVKIILNDIFESEDSD